jgi:hypothetical protein
MFSSRFGGNGGSPFPDPDFSGLADLLLKAIQDLGAMQKELKYSNWLKMIELKAKGLYDEDQLRKDLQHFGLES